MNEIRQLILSNPVGWWFFFVALLVLVVFHVLW